MKAEAEVKVIDLPYVIKRLKKLLKKGHVVKALLNDPEYRVKTYLVAGLLGIDLIGEISATPGSVERAEEAY